MKRIFLFIFLLAVTLGALHAAKKTEGDYQAMVERLAPKEVEREFEKDKKLSKTTFGYRGENLLLYALRVGKDKNMVNSLLTKITVDQRNKKKQDALQYICIYTLKDVDVARLILNQYQINKKLNLTKSLKKRDGAGRSALDYIRQNDNCMVYNELLQKVDKKLLEKYKPKSYDAWLRKLNAEAKKAEEAAKPKAPPPPPEPPKPVPPSPPESAPAQMNLFDYAPKDDNALEQNAPVIENPNAEDAMGITLLMKAARVGNDWEVKKLLEAGALVNKQDNEGWSALMYAVRYQNNEAVVNTLIQNNADLSLTNRFGTNALLMAAAYNGNPLIMKAIIENSNAGSVALFKAFILALTGNDPSDTSQVAKLQVFIDNGVSINRFYEGKTPLMYAAINCSSTAVLQLLIDNGAVKTLRDSDGKSAYDYAKENTSLSHDDTYWSLNSN